MDPIALAAHNGFEEVVQVLLEFGAKRDIAAKNGFTPLNAAEEIGADGIIRLLKGEIDTTSITSTSESEAEAEGTKVEKSKQETIKTKLVETNQGLMSGVRGILAKEGIAGLYQVGFGRASAFHPPAPAPC